MPSIDDANSQGLAFLMKSQNADGGWGYLAGKRSALEPTSYASLAVSWQRPGPPGERAAAWLSNPPQELGADPRTDAFWAPALWALIRLNQQPEVRAELVSRLLNAQVEATAPKPGQVGEPRGWAWVSGTFSWVEPTSYVLIALKCAGHNAHVRVSEAEKMLLERACPDGGWNHGDVRSYAPFSLPPTTALAAMALQNVPKAADQLGKACNVLEREVKARPSTMSLALAILCLDVFGCPLGHFCDALVARQSTDGSWRSQIHLTALAVLALRTVREERNVFKLA